MNENEFDALGLRPWSTQQASRMEAQWLQRGRLAATLGKALWGATDGDLKRQLLAAHPEVPAGFDLADFRELLLTTQTIAAVLAKPRAAWAHPSLSRPSIFIGAQAFTLWEARCEVVRRAIDYLEKR